MTGLAFSWPCSFEFLRDFRVATFVGVEIYGMNASAVFHLAFAKVVQMRTPSRIVFQVFRDMP